MADTSDDPVVEISGTRFSIVGHTRIADKKLWYDAADEETVRAMLREERFSLLRHGVTGKMFRVVAELRTAGLITDPALPLNVNIDMKRYELARDLARGFASGGQGWASIPEVLAKTAVEAADALLDLLACDNEPGPDAQ